MRPEDIDGLTVGGLLDLVHERRPDDEALVYADRDLRYTYTEFKEVVEECARALMALGIEKGDHVAVWGQNVPEWVTLQFATGKVGAVLVTINPAYKSHELKYVLEQSDAAALFLTEGVRDADFLQILQDAVPELSGCRRWRVVPRRASFPEERRPDGRRVARGAAGHGLRGAS